MLYFLHLGLAGSGSADIFFAWLLNHVDVYTSLCNIVGASVRTTVMLTLRIVLLTQYGNSCSELIC